jgi:hypothetical protein
MGSLKQGRTLIGFFVQWLESKTLIDVEPLKLLPTWRNKRVGEDIIAKRLDRFLIVDQLVASQLQFKQWVGCGGESDHLPILLEIGGDFWKPASPFKFNSTWLKDEEFHALVKSHWIPYNAQT